MPAPGFAVVPGVVGAPGWFGVVVPVPVRERPERLLPVLVEEPVPVPFVVELEPGAMPVCEPVPVEFVIGCVAPVVPGVLVTSGCVPSPVPPGLAVVPGCPYDPGCPGWPS